MSALDDLQAQLDALDTGMDNITTALTKGQTDVDKSFADLKALIAAGAPPVDLTKATATAASAISKQSAIITALSALDTDAIAADPTVPTVTAPPSA
jgi:hypothetical protein